MNDKTKFTRIYLADKSDKDEWGNSIRGNEEWRNEILLGTKLGSEEDISNRISKANTAFRSYNNIWRQGPKRAQISEERKLKLYESLVVSVLLYMVGPDTVVYLYNAFPPWGRVCGRRGGRWVDKRHQ